MKKSTSSKLLTSSKISKTSKNSKTRSNHTHDIKFESFNKLYNYVFTNLGWTILAKAHGNDNKVNHYMSSLHRLHNSIEQKIVSTHEIDKKIALMIILKNLKMLEQGAAKIL